MAKVYDVVKKLLTDFPELRNSDKKLIWAFMARKQLVQFKAGEPFAFTRVMYMDYMNAPSFESITRARRKVQELHPDLGSTGIIKERRGQKEQTKGTFIFREQTQSPLL